MTTVSRFDKDDLLKLSTNAYIHLGLILLISVLAYQKMFSIYFLSDDFNLLLGSSNWLDPKAGFFRPIPHLLVHLCYRLFGMIPLPFHLLSFLFHYGNAVLIYLILKKMWRKPLFALIGGLLFASNFLVSEAVFWISAQTTLLVTFFYLLGIYLYMNFLAKRRGRYYALVILCFICALLCKENAVTFPLVILLVDICFHAEDRSRPRLFPAVRRAAPLFLLAAGYLLLKVAALEAALTRDALTLGYHNLRNVRHLLLSLFTFNPFHDIPFLYLDIAVLNLVLPTPIPNLQVSFDIGQFFAPLLIGSLILLFCIYLLCKGRIKVRLTLLAFIVSMGPFILMSSHHVAYGGYYLYPLRLYYLPAALFFLFLASLFYRGFTWLGKRCKSRRAAIIVTVLLASLLTLSDAVKIGKRSLDWRTAGSAASSVLKQLKNFLPAAHEERTLVLFNLPDSYRGAYIFRNGIGSAVKLRYPKSRVKIQVSTSAPADYKISFEPGAREKTLLIDCAGARLTPIDPQD